MDSIFKNLYSLNVNEHVEKKGNFSYLSWPYAVAQLRLADPAATWEVKRFAEDLPYQKTDLGVFVEVSVTCQGVTLSQIHPVLDSKNRPLIEPSAFDINTSIQRCLVKAIALHGLGLYIYAGEDLPQQQGESGGEVSRPTATAKPSSDVVLLTQNQLRYIKKLVAETKTDVAQLLTFFGFESLEVIPKSEVNRVIYQPVMIAELLSKGGNSTVRNIAQAILDKDPSQIDYYSQIVKNMVGKVLTMNRGITTKKGDTYSLVGAEELSPEECAELIALCQQKIADYEQKRGDAIWEHRIRGRTPVSGSVRYEVLKRAGFRCELCGISADVKNIEVDHIDPKSLGGKDDISNYQALCYSCNANKRNTDNTDFRDVKHQYEHREAGCLFCELPASRVVDGNKLAFVIRDGFPVTPLHSLVIPKRHVPDYFGLTQAEINAINQLLTKQKILLQKSDATIDGFNIGMNCGETAGQTVFHCHVHLIPRRKGDVESPRGGVRHLIPGKGNYDAGEKG